MFPNSPAFSELAVAFDTFELNSATEPSALRLTLYEDIDPLDVSVPQGLNDNGRVLSPDPFAFERRLDDLVSEVFAHIQSGHCQTELISNFIDKLSHHHLTLNIFFNSTICGPAIDGDEVPRVNSWDENYNDCINRPADRPKSESYVDQGPSVHHSSQPSVGGVAHVESLINMMRTETFPKKRKPFADVENVRRPISLPTTPNQPKPTSNVQSDDSADLYVTTGCPDCYSMTCICERQPSPAPLSSRISTYARFGGITYSDCQPYHDAPFNHPGMNWPAGLDLPPACRDSPPSSFANLEPPHFHRSFSIADMQGSDSILHDLQRCKSDPTFDRFPKADEDSANLC
ncbi:hypothetical protein FRC02_010443 [Tulasnella sp. 418]|nr:hypothetical protein FRC02_010443 [Tulasnella sp. 418]